MRGKTVAQQKGGRGGRVLAFFLGMLFGIIFLVGALGVGVFLLLSTNIDTLFGMFNIDNKDDETGEYIYVNTDTENGGVSNLLELINEIYAMSADVQNLTLGQIDDLIPASRGIVSQYVEVMKAYVDVDYEEMRQVRFADFGTYTQNVLLDSSPSLFLSAGNGETNKLMDYVLNGVEALYVTSPSDEKIPLYVDNFYYDDGGAEEGGEACYRRVEDDAPLLSSQEKYIIQESGDPNAYDVYFYCYGDSYYIAERDVDDVKNFYFTAAEEEAEAHLYDYMYEEEYADNTGNYYLDGEEKMYYEPITWRSLIYGDSSNSFNRVMLIDIVSENNQSNEMIRELFGDMTIGDLTGGNADLKNRVDGMEISLFMDIDPNKAVMAYLGYGITNVKFDEGTGAWTANYKKEDGTVVDCTLTVDGGKITEVTYADGGGTVSVEGTTISQLSARIDGVMDEMTLGEIIEISDDNDNIILSAIKDSTVNNVDKAIAALTLNELYASEIYKTTVYSDADGDGQADTDASGNKLVDQTKSKAAKLRIAVSAEEYNSIPEEEKDNYIVFDSSYLYYMDVNGAKKFVNWDNRLTESGEDGVERSNLGKLDALPDDGEVYYTYGAPGSMWKLLLTEKNDDGSYSEMALALNDIGKLITNVSKKLTSSTLRELDDIGVIDLRTADLEIEVGGGKTLGDLELDEALNTLISLLRG